MLEKTVIRFAPKGTFCAFIEPRCDAWVIEKIASFEAFLTVYDEKAAQYPGHHLFSSFDWFDQATYTSGHAAHKHDLDPPYVDEDNEPAPPPPTPFTPSGNHFSTDPAFDVVYQKFMAKAGKANFSKMKGRLRWAVGDSDNPGFFEINTKPDMCIDPLMVIQIVPVHASEDAICAFPNGYFQGDLMPFENHALASHFSATHGLKLIAIGASHLCFLRDQPLTLAEAGAVAADILDLHTHTKGVVTQDQIAATIMGKRYVLMSYIER